MPGWLQRFRGRAGFGFATCACAGLLLLAAMCPVWAHHQVGAWWVGQIIVTSALFAGSLLLRARAQSARPRA